MTYFDQANVLKAFES